MFKKRDKEKKAVAINKKMSWKKIRFVQNLCEESVKSLKDTKEKWKTWKGLSYPP